MYGVVRWCIWPKYRAICCVAVGHPSCTQLYVWVLHYLARGRFSSIELRRNMLFQLRRLEVVVQPEKRFGCAMFFSR